MALKGEAKKLWQKAYDEKKRQEKAQARREEANGAKTAETQTQSGATKSKQSQSQSVVSSLPFCSEDMKTEFRPVITENHILDKANVDPNWVDHAGIFKLLDEKTHPLSDRGLVLWGEAGTGKTTGAEEWARKHGHPLVKICYGERKDIYELLVEKEIETDANGNTKTIRDLGALTKGIQLANQSKTKISVVILDELNQTNNQTQTDLNERVTKLSDGIQIPNTSHAVKLAKGHKVIIVGTMNPPEVNAFVNELNRPLRDRFDFEEIPPMKEAQIKGLVKGYLNPKTEEDNELVNDLVSLYKLVNANFNSKRPESINMPLTTRGLVGICRNILIGIDTHKNRTKAITKALRVGLVQKYENNDHRNTIKSLIKSQMNLEVKI